MRPFLFFVALASVAGAGPVEFSSGDRQAALIELYTSEGCSSCPPAEKWLGQLREAPGLWRDFVPVAFHVDYWNRLGWRDRFSTRDFTQRQYALAHTWEGNSVYTPCFVSDGAEWRRSRGAPGAATRPAAVLSASYEAETGILRATLARTGKTGPALEVHAAVLGGGIVSRVLDGENAGETLRHEFVALALAHGPLKADGAGELKLALPKVEGVTRLAVAVWVTGRESFRPLQATGAWLTPGEAGVPSRDLGR